MRSNGHHWQLRRYLFNYTSMPKEFGECVVKTLHGMERLIRKLSKKSFKYTTSNNIGGISQGIGEGPQDMIGLLKDVHSKTTRGCTLLHPDGEQKIVRHGGGFIDDQIDVISLDSQDAAQEKEMVEDILLHWQNLLNVSGGDLSINKCAVGFAQYKFIKSLRRDYTIMKDIDENEAQIELQPHNQLLAKEVIKRLSPYEGEKYLGVRNALSGSNNDEFKAHKEQVADMAGRVAISSITRQQAYMIHSIQYKPAILYPLQQMKSMKLMSLLLVKDQDIPIIALGQDLEVIVINQQVEKQQTRHQEQVFQREQVVKRLLI